MSNSPWPALGLSLLLVFSWEDLKWSWVAEQIHDYSCGVAAAASLMTIFWGEDAGEQMMLNELQRDVGGEERISLAEIAGLLRSHGFAARGFRLDFTQLRAAVEAYGPAIVHLDEGEGHFVLCLGVHNGRPVLGDPSDGAAVRPLQDFLRAWTGAALFVDRDDTRLDAKLLKDALRDLGSRDDVLLAWCVR